MRMDLLREDYQQYGMQTTVEGVLIVHHNNTPMVLLLEGASNYHKLYCWLSSFPYASLGFVELGSGLGQAGSCCRVRSRWRG